MMSAKTSPLFAHEAASDIVAYRQGLPIAAGQFLADARHLAECLPTGEHVLNICADRYRFAVGLAACLLTGRISLLPSTHTPEVIRQLAQFAPDAFCLADGQGSSIDLPQYRFPELARQADVPWQIPRIPTEQLAAIVFTSGSTGTPVPYKKTWGKLARCVRDGAPRLGLSGGANHTLIGTVPPQHMYGFESTVLLPLLSGNAFGAEKPFYPADIAAALAAVPPPRVLVSTPVHLRALLAADVDLPPLDLVVSATAPLADSLAHDVEARFRTRLLEIYGSTETGQIAMRRTAQAPTWRLWPDVHLSADFGQVFAQGGHVEQMTALSDVIEITGEAEFLLHGRTADLVNVAGKRSSFGYLNSQLNAIPGVVDGVFFLRDATPTGGTGVARVAAAVVAPTLTKAQLTDCLRQRIDPVFLPRPLLLVDRLPRNATGKLPHQALQSLADRDSCAQTAPPDPAAECHGHLHIAEDHPAYSGHFPGLPILPGALLLDAALNDIALERGIDLKEWRVASAKFLRAVRPGDELALEHTAAGAATIRFVVRTGSDPVASGMLSAIMPGTDARGD